MELDDRQLTELQENGLVSIQAETSIMEILRALHTLGLEPDEVVVGGYALLIVKEEISAKKD